MTDETLEQIPERDAILNAIENLSKRFDSLENKVDSLEGKVDSLIKDNDVQFEAIRKGIVDNSAAFDRLEAKFYDSRSDISNLRADIKELTEELRRKTRGTLV